MGLVGKMIKVISLVQEKQCTSDRSVAKIRRRVSWSVGGWL